MSRLSVFAPLLMCLGGLALGCRDSSYFGKLEQNRLEVPERKMVVIGRGRSYWAIKLKPHMRRVTCTVWTNRADAQGILGHWIALTNATVLIYKKRAHLKPLVPGMPSDIKIGIVRPDVAKMSFDRGGYFERFAIVGNEKPPEQIGRIDWTQIQIVDKNDMFR